MPSPTTGDGPKISGNWKNSTTAVRYTVARIDVSAGSTENDMELATALTEYPLGIIQNVPEENQHCAVQTSGNSYAVAGAAVSLDDLLGVDSAGRLVAVTKSATGTTNPEYVVGVAMSAAANADDLFKIQIRVHEMELA